MRVWQRIPICLGYAPISFKAYDSDEIIKKAEEQGMQIVIPPKKNRISKRLYDKDLYKLRHLVENAILHLKRWRGIATRYARLRRS